MKHKKIAVIIILSLPVIFCLLLNSCVIKDDIELFSDTKVAMEKIVREVLNKEIGVKENGMFVLPEDFAYLSDTGEACIVDYGHKGYGVYFFTFRGFLGSSRGFLYKLTSEEYSNINKSSEGFNFVKSKTIDEHWDAVSTDD